MLSQAENEKDRSMVAGDKDRQHFLSSYLNRLIKNEENYGKPVFEHITHVTVYSLTDSIEWEKRNTHKRGLVDKLSSSGTDFKSIKPKRSGALFREMIEQKEFENQWDVCHYNAERDDFMPGKFNDDMLFGCATAAYQVEGGWDADGKGMNIWDDWTHQCRCANCASGDIACNSYKRYMDDIDSLNTVKAQFYRFSVSWARVIPTGKIEQGINQAGLDYYHNLIDALLANNIIPMVTMYHWDIPTGIATAWLNQDIVQHFTDYSDLLFKEYGDKVKHWITFNEPSVFVYQAYEDGGMAPGNEGAERGVTAYTAGHNVILAHGYAVKNYRENYSHQNAKIGITVNMGHNEPAVKFNVDDREAAERGQFFYSGVWMHPILKRDYPEIVKYRVDERLPKFTEEELDMLEKSSDFYGVNHYTSGITYSTGHWPCPEEWEGESQYCDNPDQGGGWCDEWEKTGSSWFAVAPWPFRNLLRWIHYEYDGIPIFVTENGYSSRDEPTDWQPGTDPIHDPERTAYYTDYINQMLKAVKFDGVNMMGYAAWSLEDNFEWGQGYDERFGLFYVNHSSKGDRIDTLDRIAKDSVFEVAKIFENNGWENPNAPTDEPTEAPTDGPTDGPTDAPTDRPTDAPTDAPVTEPSSANVLYGSIVVLIISLLL